MFAEVLKVVFEAQGMVGVACDTVRLREYGKSGMPDDILDRFPERMLLVLDFASSTLVRDFELVEDAVCMTVGFESVPTFVEIPFWAIVQLVLLNPGYEPPATKKPGLRVVQ
jgi:hypothetical protein